MKQLLFVGEKNEKCSCAEQTNFGKCQISFENFNCHLTIELNPWRKTVKCSFYAIERKLKKH